MAHRHRRTLGALGLVLDEFPSLSETFILRETLELEAWGFEVVPLALRRPADGAVHAAAAELAQRTLYRLPPLSAGCLWQQLKAALRFPAGYASALWLAAGSAVRSPGTMRELVVSLLAAGCFAASIPRERRLSHVHAQFCSIPATVGLLLAEILGVTFSLSCHARDLFTRESILLGRKLHDAEFAAVCTRYGLERIESLHRIAAGSKVHLIYHGIDPQQFAPPAHREPREGPPLVLSVGRLVEKKGYDILLRAAAIARSRGAEFELHIVGEGPERQDLERLAAGLGLREAVVFHGHMTQEELLPLYRQAHAFALACIVTRDGDRDGLPNVLIEALAMGIPTVATQVGGVPELIVHEQTGLLAQPGDPNDLAAQLERIIYDEELRDRVSKAGRERVVQDFDSRRNIEQLAALLGRYARVTDHRQRAVLSPDPAGAR